MNSVLLYCNIYCKILDFSCYSSPSLAYSGFSPLTACFLLIDFKVLDSPPPFSQAVDNLFLCSM